MTIDEALAEVRRLRTHEYHWRIEVQALRDRVAELTRFNLDAGSEVRRLRGLCHDGTHLCVCNAIASTDARWQQAESALAALRQRHAEAVQLLREALPQLNDYWKMCDKGDDWLGRWYALEGDHDPQ